MRMSNPGEGWRKSSYTMSNGQCVEAARLAGGRIGVRDSKAAEGLALRFQPGPWAANRVRNQWVIGRPRTSDPGARRWAVGASGCRRSFGVDATIRIVQ